MITKLVLHNAGIDGKDATFINEDGNIYGLELINNETGVYVKQLYNQEKTGSKLLGGTTKHGMVTIEGK